MSTHKYLITRRNLILGGITMASTVACGGKHQAELTSSATPINTMPERILGETGLSLPLLGLGGAGQTPLSSRGGKAKES